MRKVVTLSICTLLLISLIGPAAGDMGAITSDQKISEPGQNAVIGWNETHEKLILSTEFRPTSPDKVKAIRVIPFPSLPSVKESSDEVFKEIDDILSELMISIGGSDSLGREALGGGGGGVTVEWKTQIGSHNLSAYKVHSSQQFADIVKDKFESQGVHDWEMDKEIDDIIEDYLSRDLRYFVIDVVDLKQDGNKIEPILYEFRSKELYYPLLISKLSERVGTVRLAVFTKRMMASEEFEKSKLDMEAYTWLNNKEVKEVSSELSAMFEKDKVAFTYFTYLGSSISKYRDIFSASYETYPGKPDYIPQLAILIFGISSIAFVWYDLIYKKSEGHEKKRD